MDLIFTLEFLAIAGSYAAATVFTTEKLKDILLKLINLNVKGALGYILSLLVDVGLIAGTKNFGASLVFIFLASQGFEGKPPAVPASVPGYYYYVLLGLSYVLAGGWIDYQKRKAKATK